MKEKHYYVAVNTYRNSTSNGFANTWETRLCESAAVRDRILRDGLPVSDQCTVDENGLRHPVYSTMGIRAATAAERRKKNREIEMGYGSEIDYCDEKHFEETK